MDERGPPSPRRFIDPFDYDNPPGHSRVAVVCPLCPRPWDDPPFRWFWMPHDVRAHLRRHKTHEVTFWCYGCRQLLEPGMTSKWDPGTYSVVDPLVRGLANEATDYGEAIQQAIDWRRREIERLQREVDGLELYFRRLRGLDQEAV